jgi:hypothetical protein
VRRCAGGTGGHRTIRVVGDAPASLLLARLFATDQPGIAFTNAEGTPTP